VKTLKILFRLFLIALVLGAIALVVVAKKKKSDEPVSFDRWPDVPTKPAPAAASPEEALV
jgi:hypothetical protein